ncbi:hypothetical protein [Rhodovulum euryhalinum]|uniref:Uncharacterized protein n=1 Tax=Rhodovulum euryhalinum TaxID=35805 RepID=A0A4R2KG34_9RHOB|nr:hypothetical protein [Rhodovulum euryhalinum]TCO71227.1 hypothetical protein EV655_107120 [Rhodovulum euryhalinum]
MSAERIIDPETAHAVEAMHWAPPVAPLEMPRQMLEAPRREGVLAWLVRLLRPLQHG